MRPRILFIVALFFFLILPGSAHSDGKSELRPFSLGEHAFGKNILKFVVANGVPGEESAPEVRPGDKFPLDFGLEIVAPANATMPPLPPNLYLDARKWFATPGKREALIVRTYNSAKEEIGTGESKCSDSNGGNLGGGLLSFEWEPTGSIERFFSVEVYDCTESSEVRSGGPARNDPKVLARMLNSPDLRAREIAAETLPTLGKSASAIADDLVLKYGSSDQTVKMRILETLVKLKDPRAIDLSLPLLDSPETRKAALRSLREYGESATRALPKLHALQTELKNNPPASEFDFTELEVEQAIQQIDPDYAKRQSDCPTFKKEIAMLKTELEQLQKKNCATPATPAFDGTDGFFPVECLFHNEEIRELRKSIKTARGGC